MKIQTRSGILLILAAGLFWSGCISTQPKKTSSVLPQYSAVTLKEFFPSISGHISDYTVQLPTDYKRYVIPSGFKQSDTIWGTPADLKSILLSEATYDFGQAAKPMLKANFTPNVSVQDGVITDVEGPMTEERFIGETRLTQVHYISGNFHGFEGVPALAVNGEMNGEQVYLAYIYSPVNDLVMFVLLQGNRNGNEDDQVWKTFVDSLEIK